MEACSKKDRLKFIRENREAKKKKKNRTKSRTSVQSGDEGALPKMREQDRSKHHTHAHTQRTGTVRLVYRSGLNYIQTVFRLCTQSVERVWTVYGQIVDSVWTVCGQIVDSLWTECVAYMTLAL